MRLTALLLLSFLTLVTANIRKNLLLHNLFNVPSAPGDSVDPQTHLSTSRLRRLPVEFFSYYGNFTASDLVLDIFGEKGSRLPTQEDAKCIADIALLSQDLKATKLWALKVIDSWGSLPSGIFTGNLIDLGNYDECLGINHAVTSSHSIKGKYCLSRVPLAPNISPVLSLKTAVCFPASCSAAIMDTMLRKLFQTLLNFELDQEIHLVREDSCQTSERELTICIIVILSILATLTFATIYDYFYHGQNTLNPVVKAFSARANCRFLFQIVETKSNPNVIDSLHGIRCLSFIWVVFGHDYLVYLFSPNLNYIDVHWWRRSAYSMLLQHAAYSVDTFFFLSGLLLVLIALRSMEKTNGKLNIPLMYLHRYLRLTPVLAVAVLVYMKILPRMGDGPLYGKVSFDEYSICESTWAWTLLYVQNYATHDICLGHSWYLAVDMQLYILSPLILIALYKWGKKGVAGIVVAMLLLAACLFSMMVINNISLITETEDAMKKIYFSTHTRASPYLIGVVFGYFLHVKRGKSFKLNWMAVVLGWALSWALLLCCIFGVFAQQKNFETPSTLEEAFYLTFTRISWPLGLCWVVFACMHGYGGIANSILSSPLWQPLSRLSYSAYIFHMFIESLNAGLVRSNTYFSDYQVMLRFWGDFGFTILLAFAVFIIIEAPFGNLEKIFLPTQKTHPPTKAAQLKGELENKKEIERPGPAPEKNIRL
ncbi:nose resistant to fluoxetine protein 6-like [Drosophila bipectinata]|uniref:nose resistant to fluoxetine protein 6-like n=1 Tax=Drosophila bipectinata TaxID=42026 RepID=UPI001C89536C|nr:nose resistant to fluoxetine protein 6-like [Drosophila bipectinata]